MFGPNLARRAVFLILCSALLGVAVAQPVAPIRPVTDDYFGTKVVDDYRYMEDLHDPEVQAWMRAQADYARAKLDAIPGRKALLERIHSLVEADVGRFAFVRRGQRYFYLANEPGAQQPKLNYRDGLDGREHLLLDPSTLGKGTTTHYAIDYFEPSWDGKLLALGVSAGGSEASVLRVLDVETGASLQEAIDRTSDAHVSWRSDNRSFFYMRFPKTAPGTPAAETMYNARTYLHRIGAAVNGDEDPVVFGRGVSAATDVPAGQGTYVIAAPGSAYAVAVANHNLDDNPSTIYVAPVSSVVGGRAPWRKIADVSDGVSQVEVRGEKLFFLSRRNAARFRLLATSLLHPDVSNAAVIVPESPGVLTHFSFDRDGLYIRQRDGATSRVRRLSVDGQQSREVKLPFEGNAGAPVTDPSEPGALIVAQGWLQSSRVFSYDPASNRAVDSGFVAPSKVDTFQLEAEEVFAVSYDGTRIPLSILHRKGLALDGSHPTILSGYGSYGRSLEPYFSRSRVAWLERGGIVAIAHLRGGGEYGDSWHEAGKKLTKLNTVLDFIACAQFLIERGYTSPSKLAGLGGSAGGIPVGGALTWRPDLFAVILDEVGFSDGLRFETEPNGPPNVVEFGSVRSEPGFHGLYAMSSYFHVRNGTPYPAVLFTTGANDPRVAPWQMAKMAARVQAASSNKRPVLLRVDYDSGHGVGSTTAQFESQLADLWSFSLWQMGDPAFQPELKP
jgi:prolyl oligopeptidase